MSCDILEGIEGLRSAALGLTLLVVGGVSTSAVGQVPPKAFIENHGQWDGALSYAARWPGLTAVVRDEVLALTVHPTATGDCGPGPSLLLARDGISPRGSGDTGAQDLRFNYFLGQDHARWRSSVPGHRVVVWRDPAAGAELQAMALPRGPVIRWVIDAGAGGDELSVGRVLGESMSFPSDGSARVARGERWLALLPPDAHERLPDGRLRRVTSRYARGDDDRIAVVVDRIDAGLPMTVSLAVEWSTYLGGSAFEDIEAILATPEGDFVVIGVTQSVDFPVTPGSFDVTLAQPGQDMFVAMLDGQTGQPKWVTYIGGPVGEVPRDAMLAPNGDVVITGGANNAFPVTPGAYYKPGTTGGVFFCRLSGDGTSLAYSGLIGASSILSAGAAALTPEQDVVIVGDTIAQDLPVTLDAMDPTPTGIGDNDGFIFKFDATGSSLLYATYFGGVGNDDLRAVAVDSNGDIVIAGPVGGVPPLPPGAFQTEYVGPYVARFSPDFGEIKAATYFGGGCTDPVTDMAIGPDGSVILVGWTCSTNLPTTPDAFQPTLSGGLGIAGYVTRFDPMLTSLVFSTFVGSGLGLRLESVHVDGSGLITVAGRADSNGFPVTAGAFDTTYNGGIGDMVVGRLRPDGKKWYYGTYVGGAKSDTGEGSSIGLGVEASGAVLVGGVTVSPDYPTTPGAWQGALNGPSDVGLTKLSMLPQGVERYGTASPGSLGLPAAAVTAMPALGSEEFGWTCTQGPPGRTGLLVLSISALEESVPAVGVGLWVDPSALLGLLVVQADALGFCERVMRVPSEPAAVGFAAYGQFLWRDPAGPSGWSASNALAVTIQP